MTKRDLISPAPLKKGDTIAIVSPATTVRSDYVAGARNALESLGFNVRVMPHALGPADGSHSSSEANRLNDFLEAYGDSNVRAILCARGGYGCIHFIDAVSPELLAADPKWVIGFSDVSAIHAMMHRAGVRSIHSSMAKHLAEFPLEDKVNTSLLKILTENKCIEYHAAPDSRNIPGSSQGELRGGNLAVLDGLTSTPFDLLVPDEGEEVILFIEDISEAIYRTERMIRRLALNGALSRYKGIIVGQFTDSKPDKNFSSTADMLRQRLPQWGASDIPIAFNFPIGHVDGNLPVVNGAKARLKVSPEGATLAFTY